MAFLPDRRAGERAMWTLGGLISIALGIVLAIRPDVGAPALATVFGLFSIVSGVTAVVLGVQARNVGEKAQQLLDPPVGTMSAHPAT